MGLEAAYIYNTEFQTTFTRMLKIFICQTPVMAANKFIQSHDINLTLNTY